MWRDLALLSSLDVEDQVVLTSSHCPEGGRSDRHAPGDPRALRVVGNETVIFEDFGPGAVTRIWMTTGEDGISRDFGPGITIRIWIDDAPTPAVSMPLGLFFSGRVPPFLAPMVVDRHRSSGGNLCYVPIAYRRSCRISVLDASSAPLWYQVTAHRLSDPRRVTPFHAALDLSQWRTLLEHPGDDPWPVGEAVTISGSLALGPGAGTVLAELNGPDLISALTIRAPSSLWFSLRLALCFDGTRTIDLPLAELFAVRRGEDHARTRSLLIGLNEDLLYCYLPMPFFDHATVTLHNDGPATAAAQFEIRRANRPPPADAGLLHAVVTDADRTTPGQDAVVLDLEGRGKWVALSAEFGSLDGGDRSYLEGDDRTFVDGALHPALYGTGVEDFVGGGFYFRIGDDEPQPFALALNGMVYDLPDPQGTAVGVYRLMLTDAPVFTSRLRVGFEGGPTGDLEMRLHCVAWVYLRPEPALVLVDRIDLGDPQSRSSHGWVVDGDHEYRALDSAFQGEPPVVLQATGCYRRAGSTRFALRGAAPGASLRLRRRFDAGLSAAPAIVRVRADLACHIPPWATSPVRRWQEMDLMLGRAPADCSEGLDLSVELSAGPDGTSAELADFVYELWSEPARPGE